MDSEHLEKNYVFLAHSKKDSTEVAVINQKLKDAGFYTWFDEEQLVAGLQWTKEIPRLISRARFFIAVISKNFIEKGSYVEKEFHLALAEMEKRSINEIFFIPVLLDNTELPAIKVGSLSLSDFHAVKIETEEKLDKLINDLWRIVDPIGRNFKDTGVLMSVRKDVAEGNLEKALREINVFAELKEVKLSNEITLLSARWSRVHTQHSKGLITDNEFLKYENQVMHSLLECVESMERQCVDEEPGSYYSLPKSQRRS